MKRPFFLLAIIMAVFILTFRFFIRENKFYAGSISHFSLVRPKHAAIKGAVISDPFYQKSYFRSVQIFTVRPEAIRLRDAWFPAYGNIRVTSFNERGVEYGDEILFQGTMKEPFSRSPFNAICTISDKDALIITGRGKGFAVKRFAYNLKDVLLQNLQNLFDAPELYFISAVLLGEREYIPKAWKEIFKKTQTMHLLAISGLHVGIAAFIMLLFIGLLGIERNLKYIITILGLILYAVMVGARPSVIRATLMCVVLIGSYIAKRDADILNSLGLAAVAILIYDPGQLFNYGFILSFASVFFIIYLTPLLNRIFRIERIDKKSVWGKSGYYFSTLFSASFAVWLGILPLTARFFNIISPISVIVNIFAIPALFVIITLTIASMMLHPLILFIGIVFAEAANFFIDVLLSFLKLFSELPFAYFESGAINISIVILYYVGLIGLIEYVKRRLFPIVKFSNLLIDNTRDL